MRVLRCSKCGSVCFNPALTVYPDQLEFEYECSFDECGELNYVTLEVRVEQIIDLRNVKKEG
jgi:hypothetical protein